MTIVAGVFLWIGSDMLETPPHVGTKPLQRSLPYLVLLMGGISALGSLCVPFWWLVSRRKGVRPMRVNERGLEDADAFGRATILWSEIDDVVRLRRGPKDLVGLVLTAKAQERFGPAINPIRLADRDNPLFAHLTADNTRITATSETLYDILIKHLERHRIAQP